MDFWNRESPTVVSTLSLTRSRIRSADHRSTASLSGSDIIPSNSEVCLLSISRGEVSPVEDEVVLEVVSLRGVVITGTIVLRNYNIINNVCIYYQYL